MTEQQIRSRPVPQEKWAVKPGDRFGRLVVTAAPFYNPRYLQYVDVECSCGTKTEKLCRYLVLGKVKKCCRTCKKTPENKANNLKQCCKCQIFKSHDHFWKNVSTYDGLHPECKDCKTGYRTLKLYGIDEAEYTRLFLAQNGLCKLCGKEPGKKRLCVDHNHETGSIRGLLCDNCNRGIGLLQDSSELLLLASRYVLTGQI